MKFLFIFALVASTAYIPLFHASAIPETVDSSIISKSDELPQIAVTTVIAGIQTVMAVIAMARQLVKDTTFKDIMATEIIPYHSELAASYGNLNADSVKMMDEELKVMMAAVNRQLTDLHNQNKEGKEIPFEEYVATMLQNPVMEKDYDGEIFRNEYKAFSHFGIARGSVDKQVVNQVVTWFQNLIGDPDVLNSTRINIMDYANIVGATETAVVNLQTVIMKTQEVERSVLEIGVLRYPDLDNPFFKMFRIKLKAYRKSVRIAFVQKDESGIKGEYNMQKFVPRKSVIAELQDATRKKAVAEVEALFSM